MPLRDVLLLSSESATVSAVGSALRSNGQLTNGNVYRELSELAARLARGTVPAALIDIDAQPKQILSALEPLARKFPATRFVVLSGVMDNDLLLEAMQVGARHFLLKKSVPADLSNVLHRLCPESGEIALGAAVTILSAGGGCGATTVAVNLAAELQAIDTDSRPVLVADLDAHYGAVATYLGVDGEYGMFDLLTRAGAIDGQLISSTALAPSDRMHAVLSTARKRLGEPVTCDAQRIGQAIDACKQAYDWTVIDAPRMAPAVTAELAQHSVATVILLQLTIKDIRVARQILTSLRERGVHADSIYLVANRYRKRGTMVRLDEAKHALGLSESQELLTAANDFYAVTEAVNLGRRLVDAAPRSDFRRDLQKLAATLAKARAASVSNEALAKAFI